MSSAVKNIHICNLVVFFFLPAMSTISSARKKSIQSYPKTGLVKREERDKNISLINSVAFWKRCTNTAFQPKSDKGYSHLISLTSEHEDVLFFIYFFINVLKTRFAFVCKHVCTTSVYVHANSEMWNSMTLFQVGVWKFRHFSTVKLNSEIN